MVRTFEAIGRLFSRQHIKSLGSLLEAAGVDIMPEAFAGTMVIACFIASILVYFVSTLLWPIRTFLFKISLILSKDLTAASPDFFTATAVIISAVVATALICLVAYVSLLMSADSRKRKVEDILPDFLSLAAANVRAGMPIDQAMWYAAKPEFGILSDEVSTIAKVTFGGVPFNKAIDRLPDRFDSKSVRRAVSLIKQGIAAGGQVADILEKTAEDSRQMKILRSEISTSLLMYVIFVVFAGAIGTPFLFAVSQKLVAIVESVFIFLPTEAPTAAAGAHPTALAMPTKPLVTSSDFFLFAFLSTIITVIFSCLIIGVISRGSKKDGVSLIPFLTALALFIFFAGSYLLEGFLSGLAF